MFTLSSENIVLEISGAPEAPLNRPKVGRVGLSEHPERVHGPEPSATQCNPAQLSRATDQLRAKIYLIGNDVIRSSLSIYLSIY